MEKLKRLQTIRSILDRISEEKIEQSKTEKEIIKNRYHEQLKKLVRGSQEYEEIKNNREQEVNEILKLIHDQTTDGVRALEKEAKALEVAMGVTI